MKPSRPNVLVAASVASMLDLFNRENFRLLQDMGCQVEAAANFRFGNITSPKRVAQFRRELAERGIRVHDIPIPRRITDVRNIVRSYQVLKKLCAHNDYRLIHTQSPIGGAVIRLAARRSRKKGTKVIYTAHGFHFYQGAPLYRWMLFYPAEKWLSYYTDTLITINAEDYRRARRFHAGRLVRLPGIGICLEDFCPDAEKRKKLRRTFGFPEQDFVVLSVGQLSRRKNQEVMIRAMAMLKDRNVRYVIAGIGEQEPKYRALIQKLGLEATVFLAGYRDDIPDLLRMADCFVFPSRQEGLPVSLMEAMAAGVPVVCSRIRGNCDLVRDGIEGRVVRANDAAGFAAAVRQIMEQPKRAESYQKHARERVRGFSKQRVNAGMERIYRQSLL
ncbi:MAG: glycosyltransferase family 4 protein [Eubacterium sp.]|nr:glycosyltransferase family 4 protein [Eubacterium sp.]